MTPFDALVEAIAALDRDDLERWVRDDLVRPLEPAAPRWVFEDSQCARVRLLCTLHYDLEIEAESLPLIVSLLDQLYDTRADLLALAQAVAMQGPAVRAAVLAALEHR